MTKKKISFYTSKKISASTSQRKAETRTKIQLGGLLLKSGLAEVFSITPGVDLQLDEEGREKATILLGALIDMRQNIVLTHPKTSQKVEWAILGKSTFITHFLNMKQKEKERISEL
ncbi:MAG: conjugal transfer protein TraD [Alphaproteobacteria bacterium]|nr:conjugal transfer protein TraD [Alphaproteobacteria bacterium]